MLPAGGQCPRAAQNIYTAHFVKFARFDLYGLYNDGAQ